MIGGWILRGHSNLNRFLGIPVCTYIQSESYLRSSLLPSSPFPKIRKFIKRRIFQKIRFFENTDFSINHQKVIFYGVSKRGSNVLLPNNTIKLLRAPLSGCNFVYQNSSLHVGVNGTRSIYMVLMNSRPCTHPRIDSYRGIRKTDSGQALLRHTS